MQCWAQRKNCVAWPPLKLLRAMLCAIEEMHRVATSGIVACTSNVAEVQTDPTSATLHTTILLRQHELVSITCNIAMLHHEQ